MINEMSAASILSRNTLEPKNVKLPTNDIKLVTLAYTTATTCIRKTPLRSYIMALKVHAKSQINKRLSLI